MRKKNLITTVAGISFAAMSLSGIAAEKPAALDGATLYKTKTCMVCHGADAQTPVLPNYPKLTGQNPGYALAQMKDIKSGTRDNGQSAVMKAFMDHSNVNDAEMEAIAEWLSNLTEESDTKVVAPKENAVTAEKEGVSAWSQMTPEQKFAIDAIADMENGKYVYEVCAACHLPEGWGREDGTFPQLSGQHRSVLIKQLADIRAGNRDNPTMYPFTTKRAIGGAQALADVTAYIATLPMNPKNGVGEGNDLKHGEKLYKENCVKCHGEKGEGSAKKFYPRIQAQHYKYMQRQFEWIRDGKRRNANPDMVKQINGFTDKDMKAVVDYASRLKPPEKDLAKDPNWKNPDFAD